MSKKFFMIYIDILFINFIKMENNINRKTRIIDIINNPIFENYGRYIFPIHRQISSSLTIENLDSIYTWYNYMKPERTIEIINYFISQIKKGNKIFYDIYTDEEKKLDPSKKDTGLFFFRGNPGQKFSIVNAGGAFSYVGAMHDSFPHALEISKRGFNSFALITPNSFESNKSKASLISCFSSSFISERNFFCFDISLLSIFDLV